tara:strand:+ start:5584 stop:6069 length:486 start_codon:yes stop_codon:yes gene_type:complete
METRFQFLESVYLPGYMGLRTEDYNGRTGIFDFKPTEPPVVAITLNYLTPMGAHIFLSQAGLCLIENTIKTEGFDMGIEDYRQLTKEGRMKIVELNQKYRREVETNKNLQGRMNLTKMRWGKMPMIKIDFDLANHAITGNMVGVLAPKPMPQMNADIIRKN